MRRSVPVIGVRHGGDPGFLGIYRPSPPFLENSHVLSEL